MAKTDAIRYLQQKADATRIDAAQALARQQAMLLDAQHKLALLGRYVAHYREEAQNAERAGVGSAQAREMRAFIAQLEQVVAVQQESLGRHRQQAAILQRQWLSARGREQALTGLLRRAEHLRHAQQLQRMQKELDEWAQRAASRLQTMA